MLAFLIEQWCAGCLPTWSGVLLVDQPDIAACTQGSSLVWMAAKAVWTEGSGTFRNMLSPQVPTVPSHAAGLGH